MSDETLKENERKLIELIILYNNSWTQKQLADEIGVTERTIQNYLRNPAVKDSVNEYYDERLWKLRPIAYKGFEHALRSEERWAIELFFKLNGEIVETKKHMGDRDNPIVHEHRLGEGMTEEEVINIAQSVIDKG